MAKLARKKTKVTSQPQLRERAIRRTAYLPVRLKKSNWMPIFQMDAQLVDLSPTGAKVQCGRDVEAWQGSVVWVEIPLLTPSNEGEEALLLKTECRWYNDEAYALGIHFLNMSEDQTKIIHQLIDDLKAVGRLAC